LPLNAGNYVWRVRGENYAYESVYSFPSSFWTTIPDDLTNQQVVLSSPDNDKFVNFINITLNWEVLNNATSYTVRVVNTATGQEVYSKPDITDTFVTLDKPTLEDGTYEWRLKAKNAETETKQYAARKFNIDTTIPNQPKNTLPADNSTQTANASVSYTWSIATDIGNAKSPISYIVEFASDVDFNTIVQTQNSNTTTLQQAFSTAGVYYWRARAVDEAGNIGTNSTKFKFTVN
jgi:enoyl reductase-like protein